ncbi:hypothetical protein CPB86DRAFT_186898 [Serendipita vermifera]|nr:hypothetical protein CPB86DRAFT_186898 [Serendipita vermifera]
MYLKHAEMTLEESQTIFPFPWFRRQVDLPSSFLNFTFLSSSFLRYFITLFYCAGTPLCTIMYKVIFLTILLAAVELTHAIPAPMRLIMDSDTGTAVEQKNLKDAERESNKMLRQAQKLINKAGTDGRAQQALTDSFGPNWEMQLPKIKEDVGKLRKAEMHVYDSSGQRTQDDKRGGQAFNAFVRKEGDTRVAHFGNNWHAKPDPRQRAGTMVHELSHAVLKTGDHLAQHPTTGRLKFVNSAEAYIKSRKKSGPETIYNGVGYMKAEAGHVIDHGAGVIGADFKTAVELAVNPRKNADSWKALMAFGQREKERNKAIAKEQRENAAVRKELAPTMSLARYNAQQQQMESVRAERAARKAQPKPDVQLCANFWSKRGLTDEHPVSIFLFSRIALFHEPFERQSSR